jgi:protein gp37
LSPARLRISDKSRIEWTDATWNPIRGCTKISPGCTHCYAQTFAERFRGVPDHPFEQGFDLRLVPDKLGEPLRWGTPKMIFVNSMSDLFHEDVPDSYIEAVANVMVTANWHIYQVLTKRATRMAKLLQTKLLPAASQTHIWWGSASRTGNAGCPGLKSFGRRLRRSDFCQSSSCSRTWARSTFAPWTRSS